MLGSLRENSSTPELPAGTGSIYVVVDNPDELYLRARAASATIVLELHDEDYGSRGFTARDHEGVYWSFGTYAGQAAAESDGGRQVWGCRKDITPAIEPG
jgi:uncharacterized glyoxalase superfamily protein PhnB